MAVETAHVTGVFSMSVADSYFKPVAVGVSIALLIGILTLYNDVQANTSHRVTAEQKDRLLVEMRESLIRMELDLKYLRSDVDALKLGQKDLTTSLQEDRDRILKPWKNQSKPE
jgi:hypothetical protein